MSGSIDRLNRSKAAHLQHLGITEAVFQEQVVELAHMLGWEHMHVRRSIGKGRSWTTATNVAGWPDLVLWSERQCRVIAAELKSQTGKATVEQLDVLTSLGRAGVESFLWRPSDLDDIQRILTGVDR